MGINDYGNTDQGLNNPPLGGPGGWAQAVRDAIQALQAGLADVVPIGGIIMWSGSTAPPRYAICDGTNGTPNLSGKFVLAHGDGKAIGATGGAATVTLTQDQMPNHGHDIPQANFISSTAPHDWEFVTGSGGGGRFVALTRNLPAATGNRGSDAAHENMPPYYVLAYIQRKS